MKQKQHKEIWKPIAGYEGFYEASNEGRVRTACQIKKRLERK